MTKSKLVIRSFFFYWRAHLGVVLGAMLAAAVLTGALLVGDSVDYSLRKFALLRLGNTHHALFSHDQFFAHDLARRLAENTDAKYAGALRLRGMAIHQPLGGAEKSQVNRVNVIGIDSDFWQFSKEGALELAGDEVAINEKLASALGVDVGDDISVRVANPGIMSRDAPLSSRAEEQMTRALFTVKEVLSDSQLGRFNLTVEQVVPYNAFVNLEWLQDRVDLAGRVNLIIASDGVSESALSEAVAGAWKTEDVGLIVRRTKSGILQIEHEGVFLDQESSRAALSLPFSHGTLTYLVNSISSEKGSTPYSFMVAGPVPEDMANDEIVINRWLADQLDAGVGETLTVTYPELLASNNFAEKTRSFKVHSIREMEDVAGELDLMPTFPGLSDVESCADWNVGMPMDEAMLADEANEEYWNDFGQTPKAFVTLESGQEMWGNRFGNLTSVRFDGNGSDEDLISAGLVKAIDPAKVGLAFQPVREQALAAVSQAMNFGQLFLGMSFFLIVSALMLTGLLFVFGLQKRAPEIGTLLALGYKTSQIRFLVLCEAGLTALVGAVAGSFIGTLYTRFLIFGLSQYWQGAVASSVIEYHAKPGTFAVGASLSLLFSLFAMMIAVWRLSKLSARELLGTDLTQTVSRGHTGRSQRMCVALSSLGLIMSLLIVVYAIVAKPAEVAPTFFGAGSLILASGLGFCLYAFGRLDSSSTLKSPTLFRMSLQNVARRRGRSLTIVGLLACGCFMVFSVSSMQEDISAHADRRESGTGGFELFAETTVPLVDDFIEDFSEAGADAVALKVRDGDDASCLNLSRAQSPRLLGVNVDDLKSREAFIPAGEETWELLNLDLPDGTVPALVGDSNTAMWNLQKKTGVDNGDELLYLDGRGNEVKLKLVGRLPMRLSVFQGSVLVSDESFSKLYPSEDGYRMFLIDTEPSEMEGVISALTSKFERFGIGVTTSVQRLEEFYAVERTYLLMFLVLGLLGVMLGTVGMGVVTLRNTLERRGELAMLRALGYGGKTIRRMLYTEHGLLLIAGIVVGGLSSALSMAPAVLYSLSPVSFSGQILLLVLVAAACTLCMVVALLAGLSKNILTALRNE